MENLTEAKIDALFKVSVTRLYPKNALSWDDSSEMAGCRCEVFEVIKGLTRSACNKLMVSLVLSHLDYANSLLGNLPKTSIRKMQLVQNIAAKITLEKRKYDSATSCLQKLHWLPIQHRIEFKIISLVHKCLHDNAPPYLQRLIQHTRPTRTGLRSEGDTTRLLVPQN